MTTDEIEPVELSIVWYGNEFTGGNELTAEAVLKDLFYPSDLLLPIFETAGKSMHHYLYCCGKSHKNVLQFKPTSFTAGMELCVSLMQWIRKKYGVTATVEVGRGEQDLSLFSASQHRRIEALENALFQAYAMFYKARDKRKRPLALLLVIENHLYRVLSEGLGNRALGEMLERGRYLYDKS